MLRLIDLRHRLSTGETLDYAGVLPRAEFDVAAAVEVVRPICAAVAERGIEALAEYSQTFDQVVPPSFRVPAEELAAAAARLDPELRAAFQTAIERRRRVSRAELGGARVEVELAPGARVMREWKGVVHEAEVLADGRVLHQGRAYDSLSAVARAITGARWNGPRFFGLRSDGR